MLTVEKQILKTSKQSVRLATTAPLPGPNIYSNGANLQPQYGTGGVGATLTGPAATALGNIDGVAPVVGDRILVNNEATAANNGIYVVTALGGAGAYILTRASDADTSLKLVGLRTLVLLGTANAGKIYGLLTDPNAALTVGTTPLSFSILNPSSAGQITVSTAFAIPAANVSVVATVSSGTNFAIGELVGLSGNGIFYGIWAVTGQAAGTVTLNNLGIEGNLTTGTVPVGTVLSLVVAPNDVSVTNVAALAALFSSSFHDGMRVFSRDVRDTFVLYLTPNTGLVNDGITIITATGPASAFWVRQNVASPTWQNQTTWFIGGAGAADTNSGLTTGLPILSWDELKRRVGSYWLLGNNTTITQQAATPSNGFLDLEVDGGSGGFILTLKNNLTATTTGTISLFTAAAPAVNTEQQVSLTTLTGAFTTAQVVQDTTANCYFLLTALVSAGIFNTTIAGSLAGGGSAQPAALDAVQAVPLATVNLRRLIMHNSALNTTEHGVCQGIAFVTETNRGQVAQLVGIQFQACTLANVSCQACDYAVSLLNGTYVWDYSNESSGGTTASINYCFLKGNTEILGRDHLNNAPTTITGCTISGLYLSGGAYAILSTGQASNALEGTLGLMPYSRIQMVGANALYGSAGAGIVRFYPFSSVFMNASNNCTIATVGSIAFSETTHLAAGPVLTAGAVVPATASLTNWSSGVGGLGAAPFSGQMLNPITFATIHQLGARFAPGALHGLRFCGRPIDGNGGALHGAVLGTTFRHGVSPFSMGSAHVNRSVSSRSWRASAMVCSVPCVGLFGSTNPRTSTRQSFARARQAARMRARFRSSGSTASGDQRRSFS
jgi:hypothetical protein